MALVVGGGKGVKGVGVGAGGVAGGGEEGRKRQAALADVAQGSGGCGG